MSWKITQNSLAFPVIQMLVGHKTADSSFLGFKTHIAMSNERMIMAAIVQLVQKVMGNTHNN
ncbi:hypothetical protein HMPREF3291_05875 [Bacillus sp. HMSC76G11]|nr:hypothetical protein HMPREF3291_05875 [Bacillus sp. HMSC76G11]